LLAESELNRAQVMDQAAALTAEIHALADRVQSFDSMASSAAVLVSGLSAFQRGQPANADAKPSWWRTMVRGAGLVSNIWLAFRPRGRNHNGD